MWFCLNLFLPRIFATQSCVLPFFAPRTSQRRCLCLSSIKVILPNQLVFQNPSSTPVLLLNCDFTNHCKQLLQIHSACCKLIALMKHIMNFCLFLVFCKILKTSLGKEDPLNLKRSVSFVQQLSSF